MLAYAIDNPPSSTIILISGDPDLAYAASLLQLRCYRVIVISIDASRLHPSLKTQASVVLDWTVDVLGAEIANDRFFMDTSPRYQYQAELPTRPSFNGRFTPFDNLESDTLHYPHTSGTRSQMFRSLDSDTLRSGEGLSGGTPARTLSSSSPIRSDTRNTTTRTGSALNSVPPSSTFGRDNVISITAGENRSNDSDVVSWLLSE